MDYSLLSLAIMLCLDEGITSFYLPAPLFHGVTFSPLWDACS
jgi:hypothetical protein